VPSLKEKKSRKTQGGQALILMAPVLESVTKPLVESSKNCPKNLRNLNMEL